MVNHENEIDPSQASSPSQSSNLNSMPNPSNIPSIKINLSDSFDQEMKMLPQSLATSKLESNNLVFTPMFNKKQETITEYKQDKKRNARNKTSISLFQFFKYADQRDILLVCVGLLAALTTAMCHILTFYTWGLMANVLIGYERFKQANTTSGINSNKTSNIFANNSLNKCFFVLDGSTEFESKFYEIVRSLIAIPCVLLLSTLTTRVCFNVSAQMQIKRIRVLLYKTMVRNEVTFFESHSPSELNNILIKDTEAILNTINYKFSDFVVYTLELIGCVVFGLASSWQATIVYLPFFVFLMLVTPFLLNKIKRHSVTELKAYDAASNVAHEVLSSIRCVLALGLAKSFMRKYVSNLRQAEYVTVKKSILIGTLEGITSTTHSLIHAVAIVYSTYLSQTQCETSRFGDFNQSFFAISYACFNMIYVINFLRELSENKVAAGRVFHVLKSSKKKVSCGEEKRGLKSFSNGSANSNGSIKFDHVYFNYPQRPELSVLNDFSLEIPLGSTVALVGASGSGKSTLVSLLERFYWPQSGRIQINDLNLNEFDLNWLRDQIGYVSQEPVLFSTTIRENIRLGRLDATNEEIENAAKQANAHEFISNLYPLKYETHVGEKGIHFSGGQKQRIAIARTLLRNPQILLLDEPTSALDYESEQMVQQALDIAKQGRTTIIVAHRLNTIRSADLIVLMKNGQVQESGSHEQLMKMQGLYYELVRNDSKSEQKNPIDVKQKEAGKLANQTEIRIEGEEKNSQCFSIPLCLTKRRECGNCFKIGRPFLYERKLLALQKPEQFWLFVGLIGQLATGALYPATKYLFSNIYFILSLTDLSQQTQQSLVYMDIIITLSILNFVAVFAYNYAFALCSSKLTNRIRLRMFESMLRQEMAFHDQEENKSSILNTKLTTVAERCNGLTTDKISLLSHGLGGVSFSFYVSFLANWKLSLALVCFVPLNFACGFIASRLSTNFKKGGKYSNEEIGSLALETMENIRTVAALGTEKYFIESMQAILSLNFKKMLWILVAHDFLLAFLVIIPYLITLTGLIYGFHLVKSENLQVEDIYKIYVPIAFSALVFLRIYNQIPDQKKASSSARKAFKIIERVSKIDSLSDEGLRLEKCQGDIEFKNVKFSYPQRRDHLILNGFNLQVNANRMSALVGPSGSGKSTIFSLLLRFYDIESGQILLDSIDIKKLNVSWLRSQFGCVQQEPVLFNLSIKENILLGLSDSSHAQFQDLVDICMKLNIHHRIEKLDDRYETIVGDKGSRLSGGERQRVAIARTLIRRPAILLLDEATSALDNYSEKEVQEVLASAQFAKTSICIAHRLSTIKMATQISVVRNGQVVEEGTHDDLLDLHGFYFQLNNCTK